MELTRWICDECNKNAEFFATGWIEAKKICRWGKSKRIEKEKAHFCSTDCMSDYFALRKKSDLRPVGIDPIERRDSSASVEPPTETEVSESPSAEISVKG